MSRVTFNGRVPKIHALGPMQGSGFCRTLCTYYMATGPSDTASWSIEPDEVTCKACRKVMANGVG